MTWALCFAVLFSLFAEQEPPMVRDKVGDFTRRIGLSSVPGLDATDGVKADWHDLPKALAAEVKGLRLEWEQVIPQQPGLVVFNWIWRRREQQVSVSVFVSGEGSRGAREQLVHLATDTTMTDVPLVLGPEGLGELAVQLMKRKYEDVIWVFRNVCVEVDNDATGLEILPIARRIQAFMKAHVVSGIAGCVPKIAGIDLSSNPVTVGETVVVTVRLSAAYRTEDLTTRIREVTGPLLQPISRDGLTASFIARTPGRAELDVIIADPKTLLSAKVGVFIDVLPADR